MTGFIILLNPSFPIQSPEQEGKVGIEILREDFVNVGEAETASQERGF